MAKLKRFGCPTSLKEPILKNGSPTPEEGRSQFPKKTELIRNVWSEPMEWERVNNSHKSIIIEDSELPPLIVPISQLERKRNVGFKAEVWYTQIPLSLCP